MGNLDYQRFRRRKRPHLNPSDGTLFVTFRLAGSIPKATVKEFKANLDWHRAQLRRVQNLNTNRDSPEFSEWLRKVEALHREWFRKTEEVLHKAQSGPTWLKNHEVATKVVENLHRLDGEAYRLDAYSVMSNHVHSVFKPFLSELELASLLDQDEDLLLEVSNKPGLSQIMFKLKGRSARECNLALNRKGSFWEHESFDHVIRPGNFDKTIRYVLNNPVKAGLVETWEDWKWSYCRDELLEIWGKK